MSFFPFYRMRYSIRVFVQMLHGSWMIEERLSIEQSVELNWLTRIFNLKYSYLESCFRLMELNDAKIENKS